MGKLHLEVVTPEKALLSLEVDSVVVPGVLGEFGVLEEHLPFLSAITPGELRYTSNDQTEYLAVTTGFAEVLDDRITVLVDAAEKPGEIDLERAQQAMERARERLARDRGSKDIDFERAEIALKRAVMRIKVVEKTR